MNYQNVWNLINDSTNNKRTEQFHFIEKKPQRNFRFFFVIAFRMLLFYQDPSR